MIRSGREREGRDTNNVNTWTSDVLRNGTNSKLQRICVPSFPRRPSWTCRSSPMAPIASSDRGGWRCPGPDSALQLIAIANCKHIQPRCVSTINMRVRKIAKKNEWMRKMFTSEANKRSQFFRHFLRQSLLLYQLVFNLKGSMFVFTIFTQKTLIIHKDRDHIMCTPFQGIQGEAESRHLYPNRPPPTAACPICRLKNRRSWSAPRLFHSQRTSPRESTGGSPETRFTLEAD